MSENENKDLVAAGDSGLLAMAIQKGLDTETLSKLIALRNEENARQAKAEFATRFARMQAEFAPVVRSKEAIDQSGRRLYAFCPLEDILQMAAPILAKHGFSYRWSEEELPNREKRIWCIISGHGHEERGYVDIPFIEPNRATNASQQRGVATTYGKRYSFLNATGIIVSGEDTDGGATVRGARPAAESSPSPAAETGADPAPGTQNPADALAMQIRDRVRRFSEIMTEAGDRGPIFTDEERAKAKRKIAGAKGATAETLAYVDTVVNEYESILDMRRVEGLKPAEAVTEELFDDRHK